MKRAIGIALLLGLLPAFACAGGGIVGDKAEVAGPVYKGVEVQCDLPDSQQLKNIGGTDGAGLCVWTSLGHAARWSNTVCLANFQEYMSHFKGGGWPQRVKEEIPKLARKNGAAAVPEFINYEGNDPAILDLCLKTGRMASVTYGYGERYRQRIAHMVNLVHFDAQYACVLDNNFPSAKNLEWMSRQEFIRRWTMQGGGWAVVLLDPPPPPVPIARLQRCREEPPMFGLVTTLTALTLGQWGGGSCGPVGPPAFSPMNFAAPQIPAAPVAQQPAEQLIRRAPFWEKRNRDPGRAYLMKGLRQFGCWECGERYFRSYDPDWKTWGKKVGTPPDWAPPLPAWAKDFPPNGVQRQPQATAQAPAAGVKNFGMDWKPAGAGEKYTLSRGGLDLDVSRQGAFAAITGDLADDSGKHSLTVIGSKDACERVRKDIESNPRLSRVRDRCKVQTYRPDAWEVQGFNLDKLKVKADPMIYVSAPGLTKAKVVYGQAGYRGADDLVGGLRKVDPNFDPNPAPAPAPQPAPSPAPSPDPSPAPEPNEIPPWAWLALAGGIVFVLVLFRKPPE